MRDIVVRNLTSGDWLNRDCLITEIMRQGALVTRVIRRCTYRVESRVTVTSTDDSIRWAKNLDPLQPRQVFVTKEFDPEGGEERVLYKVLGHIYVVWDRAVICIGYRHILSMTVESASSVCEE